MQNLLKGKLPLGYKKWPDGSSENSPMAPIFFELKYGEESRMIIIPRDPADAASLGQVAPRTYQASLQPDLT